ncbi:MAG: BofC C-terminal domain-containing protein [Bacillota bacterium]|nr:BofC C-terminal domain-containing protein [Bacillota bacterium]
MTLRRRTFVLFSLVAAVAAGGFVFTYWIFSQQAERFLRSPNRERWFAGQLPGPRRVDPLTLSSPPVPRTTADTVIVRRTYYPDCGDEVVVRQKAGKALSGKTAEELVRGEGQVAVESFNEREVVLLVTASGACPRHLAQRYLGIADGHVAIFQGLPGGGKAKVIEVFDLEAGALPEREVQDLRRGVPVRSDDELKRVLQSYLELVGF